MLCGISGEVPQEAVVTKSGQVYERRLIEKYIEEHHKSPVTGEPLTTDDLIAIQNVLPVVKPRAPAATSIPSLLSLFQNEWDAVMLETFTLKQQHQQTRQELSHALYQYDAACRVIARLKKERDAARDALATLKAQMGTVSASETHAKHTGDAMDVDRSETAAAEASPPSPPSKMPDEISAAIVDLSQDLSQTRRKRKAPEGHVSKEELQSFTCVGTLPSLHASGSPGILAVDVNPRNPDQFITAGVDKQLKIHSRSEETSEITLKSHTKAVTDVIWHPTEDCLISASMDSSVKVWTAPKGDDKYKAVTTLKAHKGSVSAISLHASGKYLLSAGADGAWGFHDIPVGKTVFTVDGDAAYSAAQFHPDGLILATGSQDEGVVKVWDARTQTVAFECPEQHAGGVTSLAFSENGYFFASAGGREGAVKIWDLRKLIKSSEMSMDGGVVNSIQFDYSGQYLAAVGTDLRVFLAKQWTQLLHIAGENSQDFTDVVFSDRKASALATVSMDRSLKFFGVAP